MLTITVDDSEFRDDLYQLYERMGSLTPVMDQIGMEFESRISGRFETRTDPWGHSWKPWATSTLESYPWAGTTAAKKASTSGSKTAKKAHGVGNGNLLDLYGDMLLSLSHKADSTSVSIGFGQPYAAFHEFGTKHMPRRGLMFGDPVAGTLTPNDDAYVIDVIGEWLTKT